MGSIASQITGVSIVYSTICSDADQRKNQSSVSLASVRGIHRWPANSPHKAPVTRKVFPLDDFIMKRYIGGLNVNQLFILSQVICGCWYFAHNSDWLNYCVYKWFDIIVVVCIVWQLLYGGWPITSMVVAGMWPLQSCCPNNRKTNNTGVELPRSYGCVHTRSSMPHKTW